MANPFQQKARQRKIAYFVAILVLFSAALLFRRNVVEKKADELQLREVASGEVELTGSAVRLALTGSRGIASTFLWYAAIEQQKKHEWNEVDLLVKAITKLQPNFVTPWLFQSWNLAFNVSVECDQPRDKYFYIKRGIELLAEGERRNKGRGEYPGSPEIRQTMGIYYLRKIGLPDEKTTMRCLLDLSCIDPVKRNPQRFKTVDAATRRETINRTELAAFCQANPRLIRRLREGLGYSSEKQIIEFLDRNKDVPSRFKTYDWKDPTLKETELLEPEQQFPVLPPAHPEIATNPTDYNLTKESVDPFLMARSWVEYSQMPLPPPDPDDKQVRKLVAEGKKFRLPKAMAIILFRGYPARCQAYIAENLEEEGWFDEDGWVVKNWFDKDVAQTDDDFRIGTETKYHAQPSWQRAANLYYEYGRANDLLFGPETVAELTAKAQPYRKKYKVESGRVGDLRADDQETLKDSWRAHHRLVWNMQNLGMSNYDNHYYGALAESTRDCVVGRKLLHRTDVLRKIESAPEQAIVTFEQAWPYWVNVLLANPRFASQPMAQEDLYEYLLKNIRMVQRERSSVMRPIVAGMAQMAVWPHPPFEKLMTPSDQKQVFPIRNVRGILDWILVPSLPEKDLEKTRMFLAVWPNATAGFPALMQAPPVWNLELTQSVSRTENPPAGWRHLVDETNIVTVRDRLEVNKK